MIGRIKRNGSSLVELMVAIVVLGFVLLGIMAGMLIARHSVIYKEYEGARQIGLQVLEHLEAIRFEDVRTAAADQFNGRVFGGYTVHVDVASSDTAPDFAYKITVSVDMRDRQSGLPVPPMVREVSASGWRNVGETGN
jgi:Tfp pilus assembly protein PilV